MKEPPVLKKFHALLFMVAASAAAYFLLSPDAGRVIEGIGSLGYLGALVSGFFFSSLFTTFPATVSFFLLGKTLNPFLVAGLGALGASTADLLLYHLFRHRLSHHYGLYEQLKGWFLRRMLIISLQKHQSFRVFRYCVPVVGALIIASPLPDELGIAVLGTSKYSNRKLFPIAFVLNYSGILAITLMNRLV